MQLVWLKELMEVIKVDSKPTWLILDIRKEIHPCKVAQWAQLIDHKKRQPEVLSVCPVREASEDPIMETP